MPMFLSALLYSQKLHSDHESILQIFNQRILALILVKPEIFQLFFFSIPKQNPADKQYMPQKHLQLKTVAAYMCCSQPGQYRQSNFTSIIPKNSFKTAPWFFT